MKKLLLILGLMIILSNLVLAEEFCFSTDIGYICEDYKVSFRHDFIDNKGNTHENGKYVATYYIYLDEDEKPDYHGAIIDNDNSFNDEWNYIARGMDWSMWGITRYKDGVLVFEKFREINP